MRRLRWSRVLIGAAALAWAYGPAGAQTSWPRITAVAPGGGQRGTTVELTITGINVDTATGLLFEGEGLAVESVTPEKPAPPPADKKPAEVPKNRTGKLTAMVRIAPDAEPGLRELRVLSPLGPSEVARFVVGLYPEVAEQEPNNTREQAQAVTLPATVAGQVSPAEDMDCYRFAARAGQTLVFEVFAQGMESALDSILSLQDSSGRELALNEDFHGRDSLLAYTFPRAGDYFLFIRDLRYQGSANHTYRLTLGEIPYVTAVHPTGGRAGESLDLELIGYNLGGTRSAKVTLPPSASGRVPLTLRLPTGVTNPIWLTVDNPEARVEAEPNDEPAQATTVPVPGVAYGRLFAAPAPDVSAVRSASGASQAAASATDSDCFRFRAEKDQRLILEITARRHGSSLDSVLVVTDAAGKEVAANDDAGGKDSRIEFTTPATGEYVARITDLHGRHGPDFAYQFSIRPREPDFTLQFAPDRLAVGAGGRIPLTITAQRLNGFDREIGIELAGLPEGVSVVGPSRIRAGQQEATLVLAAAPAAAVQTTAFQVNGTAAIDGKTVRRRAQGLEALPDRNNPQQPTRPVRLLTAAVTEVPELKVEASVAEVTLPKGGQAEIAVKIERKEGSKGKVPLAVLGLPQGVTAAAPEIPEDKAEGKVTLKAEPRAAVGEIEIVVVAQSVIDNQRRVPHATLPILLKVTPPPSAEEKQ